ncbi:gliding motility-associated lipoprotein GldB [Bacteroidales bacterium Barb6XT]|nr:gliding motility-associated lipoprotein GldB [Bacteroidales bacterium Barb6XT]
MKMIQRTLLTALLLILATGCSKSAPPVHIQRFDIALLHAVQSQDTAQITLLREQYPVMLDIIGKSVLNMQSPDQPGFSKQVIQYYSEPTLQKLYQEAVTLFADVTDAEQQLADAFAFLTSQFPSMQIPAVYMHVSGFNQNILVGEGTLSLSIDKYMGDDYPLYQEFFYDYQRQKMQPRNIVQDYLAGFLMSEYPFTGNENILLERMIYEGKIRYLLAQALPGVTPARLTGCTEEEYQWVKSHESSIWQAIIERKHLYTSDPLTTARYFSDRPSDFLSDGAPGNLGTCIGFQIITCYMQENAATLPTFMHHTEPQSLLTASKYKP